MVSTAQRVRTSLVLGAAGATVIAAFLLTARTNQPPLPAATEVASDGMVLAARLTSAQILAGDHEQNLAVTIAAAPGHAAVRPPLSLAVVIDRSGSMNGDPIRNAKAAATRLIDQLGPDDAFSVVTYSSTDESVMPMVSATPGNKRAAHLAIERIYDDGGTCISCGLTHGAHDLARTPVVGGVRRIVLISDGVANAGIFDRTELAELAATTAAQGVSISTLGVGLDFDELTMTQLAEVGHGNYYFVENTSELGTIFVRELGGLAETVASDVRLSLSTEPGIRIEEVYGYPMVREGNSVVVPVADLRAGETRKVVLRVSIASTEPGPITVSHVALDWRRVDVAASEQRHASTTVQTEIVEDRAAVAASVDRDAVQAVEQALAGRSLEEATTVYEQQGYEAAKQVIERRVRAAHANKNIAPATMQMIERASGDALGSFEAEPAGGAAGGKARKATRVDAYKLAR